MALGRRLASSGDENVKIELSPMIDCVFILLIFFIVTTVFVEEVGIQVNRPDAGAPSRAQDVEIVEFNISSNGVVRFRNRDVGAQGVRSIVQEMRVNRPDIPVLISAEEKVPHRVFAEVYGEIRMAGATIISFK